VSQVYNKDTLVCELYEVYQGTFLPRGAKYIHVPHVATLPCVAT